MQVNILLFALYRDLAGTGELRLELPPGATAAAAVGALRTGSGRLAQLPERPVVAVNREFAALETVLSDGDELALLPPVAGG